MKKRYGFVSNSSSSSFILPVKSEDQKITITLSVDELEDMFEADDYDSSSIKGVLKTKEDVDNYMIRQFGENFMEYLEEDGYDNEYKQMLEMVESGQTVLVGRIMYGDSFLYNLVKKMGGTIEN